MSVVKQALTQALLCAWNSVFGGIALIMAVIATIGKGIEMTGTTIKLSATALGLGVCEYQMDMENGPDE